MGLIVRNIRKKDSNTLCVIIGLSEPGTKNGNLTILAGDEIIVEEEVELHFPPQDKCYSVDLVPGTVYNIKVILSAVDEESWEHNAIIDF